MTSQTIPTTLAPTVTSFTPEVQSPAFSGLVQEVVTVNTLASTSTTVTAAQMLGGLLLQNNAAPVTTTLDTAANVFLAMQSPQVGSSFSFTLRNTGSSTATVAAGTGGTISGTATVATATQRAFRVVLTALGDALGTGAAYTAYTAGSGTY